MPNGTRGVFYLDLVGAIPHHTASLVYLSKLEGLPSVLYSTVESIDLPRSPKPEYLARQGVSHSRLCLSFTMCYCLVPYFTLATLFSTT